MDVTWPEIKAKRKYLLSSNTLNVDTLSPEEQRIASYASFNIEWAVQWAEVGPQVEAAWQESYMAPNYTQASFERIWSKYEQQGIPFYHLLPETP